MGIWSWFFPSVEERIARAKREMDEEDWAHARLALMGIDHPDAQVALAECEKQLCLMNLDAAVSWADAGDLDRVEHHMEVAENFRGPGLEEDFREARRKLRETRALLEQEKKDQEEAQRRTAENVFVPSEFIADDLPETADDEAAARIALVVESYDESLKSSVGALGATFATAILDMEDANPQKALQGLLQLPDDVAVVRYERARALYAMGDSKSATVELVAFVELHGKHANMGKHQTGLFLATTLAESGELERSLALIRAERRADPNFGGGLYAQLLEAKEEYPEADKVLVGLVRLYSKDSGLYTMLARVRAAAGNRRGAMTTLEAGIEACSSSPGSCGYRPPDVRVIRSLATLYLEDGIETERALELAGQAQGLVQKPGWEDVYLQALAARSKGDPDAPQLASSLRDHTPDGDDGRSERLVKYLPGPT